MTSVSRSLDFIRFKVFKIQKNKQATNSGNLTKSECRLYFRFFFPFVYSRAVMLSLRLMQSLKMRKLIGILS